MIEEAKYEANNRAEIASIKDALFKVLHAPLPIDQVRTHAQGHLDRLEAPYLEALSLAARRLAHMQNARDAHLYSDIGTSDRSRIAFTLGMVVHFNRDALLEELMSQARAVPTAPRLTTTDRMQQTGDLEHSLYQLELQDEKMVEEFGIARRPDADRKNKGRLRLLSEQGWRPGKEVVAMNARGGHCQ